MATATQIRQAEDQLQLFGRTVSLVIARQPEGFVGSNPGYFDQLGNGIEITDLRVEFEIKKNLGKEPNTCTCTVYNMSKESRALVDNRPLYARLAAGYAGVNRLMFAGNVTFAFSRRNGTDWETKIQIGDGQRAFSHAFLSRSYAKPVSAKQVLSDAATSMGLKLPPEAEQSPELQQALATGINTHGPAREILTRLLAPYGFGWSVQNGRLQILADGQVSNTTATLINQDSGMLGSPQHGIPHRPGEPADLTVEALVYPEILPGGMIEVESEAINGLYKAHDVTHKGDTHGDDWSTEVKALPLGQSKHKVRRRGRGILP